ncbi:hypothetical protein D3C75_725760 [compost metagenome]
MRRIALGRHRSTASPAVPVLPARLAVPVPAPETTIAARPARAPAAARAIGQYAEPTLYGAANWMGLGSAHWRRPDPATAHSQPALPSIAAPIPARTAVHPVPPPGETGNDSGLRRRRTHGHRTPLPRSTAASPTRPRHSAPAVPAHAARHTARTAAHRPTPPRLPPMPSGPAPRALALAPREVADDPNPWLTPPCNRKRWKSPGNRIRSGSH